MTLYFKRCTYSWKGNNLFQKRDLFLHVGMGRNSWHRQATLQPKRCFQKNVKYFLPNSHGWEVSSSAKAYRGRLTGSLPTCRAIKLSTQRLGRSDLYSQSLQHNLFWTDVPTITKQFTAQELPRKSINQVTVWFLPVGLSQDIKERLNVSKWPRPDWGFDFKTVSPNQTPETRPRETHTDPSTREHTEHLTSSAEFLFTLMSSPCVQTATWSFMMKNLGDMMLDEMRQAQKKQMLYNNLTYSWNLKSLNSERQTGGEGLSRLRRQVDEGIGPKLLHLT